MQKRMSAGRKRRKFYKQEYILTARGKRVLELGLHINKGFENSRLIQFLYLFSKGLNNLQTLEKILYYGWKSRMPTANTIKPFMNLVGYAVKEGYLLLKGKEPIMLESKISRSKYPRVKNALSDPTRKKIYNYIARHPGAHYNKLHSDLDLPNGVLYYHIKFLLEDELVASKREGQYRLFYLPNRKSEVSYKSKIRKKIFSIIRKFPGVTRKELAKKVRTTKRIIEYHCKILLKGELIIQQKSGTKNKLFIKVS